jgi:tRNASer (uridine44-2'-O)-methyltransferase
MSIDGCNRDISLNPPVEYQEGWRWFNFNQKSSPLRSILLVLLTSQYPSLAQNRTYANATKMTTPPTVKTPPYKPTTPQHPLLPNLISPWTTPCHFTLPTFLHVLKDLTLHPERNSSLILRADPIPLDTQSQVKSTIEEDEGFEEWIRGEGMELVEEIRVRLMPKQPKRDGKLDQRVVFYRSKELDGHEEGMEKGEKGVVVMIPMVRDVGEIPFFHPPVKKLVFYFETIIREPVEDEVIPGMKDLSASDTIKGETLVEAEPEVHGRISISYEPFIPTSEPTALLLPTSGGSLSENPLLGLRRTSLPRKRSPLAGPEQTTTDSPKEKEDPQVTQARLDRTCLALLERVYKHGFGQMVGYKKRVNHDVLHFPQARRIQLI